MHLKVTVLGGQVARDASRANWPSASPPPTPSTRRLREAGIVLLEPIMRLEVTTPEENLGDIVSDLQQRRAIITRTHARGRITVIDAQAPLANLFGYSNAMRGLSQGRATCTMEPASYGPAPPEVLEKLWDGVRSLYCQPCERRSSRSNGNGHGRHGRGIGARRDSQTISSTPRCGCGKIGGSCRRRPAPASEDP